MHCSIIKANLILLTQTLLLITSVTNLSYGKVIQVRRCDDRNESTNQTLFEVRVTPCHSEPCAFRPDSYVKFEIDFIAKKNFTKLKTEMTAKLLGNRIKLPIFHRDVCNPIYGLTCPLQEAHKYTFKYDILIPKLTPRLTTQLKWKLMQDSGNDVYCFLMIAKIL